MAQSPTKPVVKSFVSKPKKKSFINLSSPKDICITTVSLVALTFLGINVVGTLNARLGNTEEGRRGKEILANIEADMAEIERRYSQPSKPRQTNWYDGGTLHGASVREWRQASYGNKLATCGDFLEKLWQDGLLKPALDDIVANPDQRKILADIIVKTMDKVLAPSAENRRIYQNRTVPEMAGYVIAAAGFTK